MQSLSTMVTMLLVCSPWLASAVLREPPSMVEAIASRDAALHNEMRSIMEDDGDDSTGAKLLQVDNADSTNEASYMEDSAASLSSALGPRWIGSELEADAKAKTDVLMRGIAGHHALGALNRMLGALP
mmetsp:Transcript_100775/g.200201  ORF Transcript_100775/g.200201 Transcript_100775/m.200201 type:complete len:128 (+) Transcript_100775:78-461(+)